MTNKAIVAALLAGALAQPARGAEPPSAEALAAELTELRARMALLEAELALRSVREPAPEPAPAPALAPAPAAPAAEPKSSSSLTVKPFGRLQYDVAHVGRPDGVVDPSLGFGHELRRARLGLEGSLSGGFGFKLELDFADNDVEITDAILTYKASDQATLALGQHNNFQSLEELTSSRFTSFLERAAFTDAFGFERRVGLSATWTKDALIAQGGVFTDNIDDLTGTSTNKAAGLDARLVYAPKAGGTQLHLGASAHWRDPGANAPATRYRQRPFVHSTDTRFLATPSLPLEDETSYGLEAAMIRGAFHAVGELHWLKADALAPGLSPTFFGGYAEAGVYLTGETRGYKGGKFDRTKVLKPVGGGGFGAVQLNLRYDHLDLTGGPVVGGRQAGYAASLVWIPQDHVRFLINFAHLRYEEAAVAAAGGNRDYGVNVIGARAQVDF